MRCLQRKAARVALLSLLVIRLSHSTTVRSDDMSTRTSTLEILPGYRRLHALYSEAAARALTESDRRHWVHQKDQLFALPDEVDFRAPGVLIAARQLLESESQRMNQHIAAQIADHLR